MTGYPKKGTGRVLEDGMEGLVPLGAAAGAVAPLCPAGTARLAFASVHACCCYYDASAGFYTLVPTLEHPHPGKELTRPSRLGAPLLAGVNAAAGAPISRIGRAAGSLHSRSSSLATGLVLCRPGGGPFARDSAERSGERLHVWVPKPQAPLLPYWGPRAPQSASRSAAPGVSVALNSAAGRPKSHLKSGIPPVRRTCRAFAPLPPAAGPAPASAPSSLRGITNFGRACASLALVCRTWQGGEGCGRHGKPTTTRLTRLSSRQAGGGPGPAPLAASPAAASAPLPQTRALAPGDRPMSPEFSALEAAAMPPCPSPCRTRRGLPSSAAPLRAWPPTTRTPTPRFTRR